MTNVTNNINNARTVSASYDALNRISSAQSQATSGANCWGESYGYDRWSNLLSISLTQCAGGSLSLGVTNNHITNTGFSYDPAGNMTGDGSYTYGYDAVGRLTSAAGVTYTYDARDLRVKKSNGTLYWRGYLGEAFAESDLSGSIQNEYVFFGGFRKVRVSSGSIFYYFVDRLGSVRAIANGSGAVCYDSDYTSFGTELAFTNTCSQNYKFTGFERDPETGLDYATYRQYSSRLARFLQPDPVGGSTTQPKSLNSYAYVHNDPLNFTDLLGLSPCPAGYHPATADEAKSIIAAINSFVAANAGHSIAWAPAPGIQRDSRNQITSIDCSHLFNEILKMVPGTAVPYQTATSIFKNPEAAIGMTSDGTGPQVGDAISFPSHIGIVTSAGSPLGFFGSQSSTGPAQTDTGPGHGFSRQQVKFFQICFKDKTSAPAMAVKAATSGQTITLSGGFNFLDLAISPTPTGSVSTQIVNTGAIAPDGTIVPTVTVEAPPIDTTSVDLGNTLTLPPDPVLPPVTGDPVMIDGGGGGGGESAPPVEEEDED